jgi:hypothetical protein
VFAHSVNAYEGSRNGDKLSSFLHNGDFIMQTRERKKHAHPQTEARGQQKHAHPDPP